jgi:beta-lactamase class A
MCKQKIVVFLCLAMLCNNVLWAQKTDKKLKEQLEAAFNGFNGTVGIYVKNLRNNKIAAINADTVFPTASMVKVPILVGIMHKIQHGQLTYHQPLTYKDSLLYAGEDILGSFKNNEKIELAKVVMLMLTTSDNTASLWLQSLAGTGSFINSLMDSLNLTHTKVNSRTIGREANRNLYGWGQTTPKEMASLFNLLVEGKVINEQKSQQMIRLLGRNYWDEEAISQIPSNVFVASKNGAVNASRSEVLYVHGKTPYIFCIITKNNKDTSWEKSNEAWELTRKVSAMLYTYFNK